MSLFAPFLVVGAGKMGGSILSALLQQAAQSFSQHTDGSHADLSPADGSTRALFLSPDDLTVVDPAPPDDVREMLERVGCPPQAEIELSAPPALVMVGVKPQMMSAVLSELRGHVGGETLVLSIAAGKTLADLAADLPPETPIVRAMPNTPISVQAGMTVFVANEFVVPAQKNKLTQLFAPTGAVAWLQDERSMDAVTAVSGSGPAYVFWLAECLTKAGVEAGLDEDLALQLAENTIFGAGRLMTSAADVPAVLRENVTSKGGTTAAALEVLMAEDGFEGLLSEAVQAAVKRAKEL